jgi:NAD(P)-dependent dehydrogenase (short-subunit alcohol dehydrogenase family)
MHSSTETLNGVKRAWSYEPSICVRPRATLSGSEPRSIHRQRSIIGVDMRGLQGKVSVVVGAAPGNIGAAAANRLAEEGSTVVVASHSKSSGEQVAAEIHDTGGTAIWHEVDIASEESWGDLVGFAVKEVGGIDNLFSVAADLSVETMGVDSESDILSIPTEVWKRTLDVNLTGYMLGAKSTIPVMLERGGGSIVNTMSGAAWLAEPIRLAYGTSKLGIAALTRHIAAAMGKRGVRCNAVSPGLVLTSASLRVMTQEARDSILAALPTTRLGVPDDIAAMVAFLFSDDGAWINGQTIRVDGGGVMR